MDALGLERNDVEKTLLQGMKWKERGTDKWHANMASIECVFMREGDNMYVITVYLNRVEK